MELVNKAKFRILTPTEKRFIKKKDEEGKHLAIYLSTDTTYESCLELYEEVDLEEEAEESNSGSQGE